MLLLSTSEGTHWGFLMHKFNIIWGGALLVFSIGAMIFVAASGKPPVFYGLALLPFVFGGNSLHIGLKEKRRLENTDKEY